MKPPLCDKQEPGFEGQQWMPMESLERMNKSASLEQYPVGVEEGTRLDAAFPRKNGTLQNFPD
jgi:hypothetical protein